MHLVLEVRQKLEGEANIFSLYTTQQKRELNQ